MGKISSYTYDTSPTLSDYALGNQASGPTTSKFKFSDILALLAGGGTEISAAIQSQANAGTAGGTMYYINLGGLKFLWLITGNVTGGTGGNPFTVTFPTSFFSAIQHAVGGLVSADTTPNQDVYLTNLLATGLTVNIYANAGTGNELASLLVIGT